MILIMLGSSQDPTMKHNKERTTIKLLLWTHGPGVNYSLITPEAIMAMKSPPGDESPLRQGAGGDLLNPPRWDSRRRRLWKVFRIVALGTGVFATEALSRRKGNAGGHTRAPHPRSARPGPGPRRPMVSAPRGPTSLALRSSGSFVQK